MDCPTCNQAMSFVPANQNWWCNPCLSTVNGDAPSGLAGPTVDQIANDPHNASISPSAIENSRGRSFDLTDLLDPGLLALLLLVGGGVLIYMSHYVIGGIIIGIVIAAGAFISE